MDATPSVSPADSGPSEYEAHRIARGMKEAPKAIEAPVETPAPVEAPETPEAPVNPLAAAPEPTEDPDPGDVTPEPKGPEAVAHRWKDPDTGVTLDLRRRDHRRMKRLLEERSDLSAQLTRMRAQLSQPPTPEPTQAPPRASVAAPSPAEPTLEQFADQPDPYAAYMDAKIQHGIQQALTKTQSERASVERTQQTQAAIASAQQAFDAQLPDVRARYPDFDHAHTELYDTLARVPAGVRAGVVHRLLTSPVKHDLAYYLGNHPEDLATLTSARSAHEQAIALGRIEASVEQALKAAPTQTSTTRAPAPITPVNAGAPSARRDLAQLAKDGDYQAYRTTRGMPTTGMTAAR